MHKVKSCWDEESKYLLYIKKKNGISKLAVYDQCQCWIYEYEVYLSS